MKSILDIIIKYKRRIFSNTIASTAKIFFLLGEEISEPQQKKLSDLAIYRPEKGYYCNFDKIIKNLPVPVTSYVCGILDAHGLVFARGKEKESHRIKIGGDLGKLSVFIKAIQRKYGIKEFYIISCYGSALIHELNERIEEYEIGTSVTIFASSKHVTFSTHGQRVVNYIRKTKRNNNTTTSPEAIVGEQMACSPETISFFRVVNSKNSKKGVNIKFNGPKRENKNKKRKSTLHVYKDRDKLELYLTQSALFPIKRNNSNNDFFTLEEDEDYQKIESQIYKACSNKLSSLKLKDIHWREKYLDQALQISIKNGYINSMEYLLSIGANIENQSISSMGALETAVVKWDIRLFNLLLEKYNINPNLQNENGESALHRACKRGLEGIHDEMVEKLLSDLRTNPNITDLDGRTPLYYLAYCNDNEVIATLLLNHPKIQPMIADSLGVTPLHQACAKGHVKIVEKLFNDSRVDPAVSDFKGRTSFYIACQYGCNKIVEFLLQENINPLQPDKYGRSSFQVACERNHLKTVNTLLKNKIVNSALSSKDITIMLFSTIKKKHFQLASRLSLVLLDNLFCKGQEAYIFVKQNVRYITRMLKDIFLQAQLGIVIFFKEKEINKRKILYYTKMLCFYCANHEISLHHSPRYRSHPI